MFSWGFFLFLLLLYVVFKLTPLTSETLFAQAFMSVIKVNTFGQTRFTTWARSALVRQCFPKSFGLRVILEHFPGFLITAHFVVALPLEVPLLQLLEPSRVRSLVPRQNLV